MRDFAVSALILNPANLLNFLNLCWICHLNLMVFWFYNYTICSNDGFNFSFPNVTFHIFLLSNALVCDPVGQGCP